VAFSAPSGIVIALDSGFNERRVLWLKGRRRRFIKFGIVEAIIKRTMERMKILVGVVKYSLKLFALL